MLIMIMTKFAVYPQCHYCRTESRLYLNLDMLVFAEGEKLENPEETLGVGMKVNNKLKPHKTSSPGNKPGPHWREVSPITNAPSLLSLLTAPKNSRHGFVS